MARNIMCFFLLDGVATIYRLYQEQLESFKISKFATLIMFVDKDMSIKDRYGLFKPDSYPISTEADILKWLDEHEALADGTQSDITSGKIPGSVPSGLALKILKARPSNGFDADFIFDSDRFLTGEGLREEALRIPDYITLLPSLDIPAEIVKAAEEVSNWHKSRGLGRWELAGCADQSHYTALKTTSKLVVSAQRAYPAEPFALTKHIDELDNLLR